MLTNDNRSVMDGRGWRGRKYRGERAGVGVVWGVVRVGVLWEQLWH